MVDAFSPIELGSATPANRFALTPRNRGAAEGTATPQMAEYHRQRASAGLIVTGLHRPARVAGAAGSDPGAAGAVARQARRQSARGGGTPPAARGGPGRPGLRPRRCRRVRLNLPGQTRPTATHRAGRPHNEPDPATFYGGATGYTDYPFLEG
ncbi:hypothetical protein GCM10011579_033710 [Streptomyces albiflavescens]|uniref:NADH:flavin oxidoreductase/NADH oxidase N-terminal domain-containing protein n=1 Tax=Streptomyces albiflavescens TaxID=1623582 RepID=A0A918D4R4_9ACTN|nr:hypothetical protein GCM10011579_033710 [Streptomyces albiflavescens]